MEVNFRNNSPDATNTTYTFDYGDGSSPGPKGNRQKYKEHIRFYNRRDPYLSCKDDSDRSMRAACARLTTLKFCQIRLLLTW